MSEATGAEQRWRERVAAVLKGEPFETLRSRTADDIVVEPLYAEGEAVARSFRQRPERPWFVVQRVDDSETGRANELALADLAGGADALALVFRGAPAARGFGLDPARLAVSLRNVDLDLVSLSLDLGNAAEGVGAMLALVAAQGHVAETLRIDWGLDPMNQHGPATAALVRSILDAGFAGPVLRADGRAHHEAGASEAQELGAVLATAVQGLRLLEREGHGLDAARRQISFTLAADEDLFLGIAKFRALRRLWAMVEEACGLAPEPVRVAAETSFRMTARLDPATNWLRATSALLAAGLGGADAITVLPHTSALGLPDAFSRRMARNAQAIAIEEAGLAAFDDPAAGSGAVEALTDALVGQGWQIFREIEAAGGLAALFGNGRWAERLARSADAREAAIREGRAVLVGTTRYRDSGERAAAVLAPALAPAPHALLPGKRDAAPFEELVG